MKFNPTEDEAIDDKYGVAVVFHDDEEEVSALLEVWLFLIMHTFALGSRKPDISYQGWRGDRRR